MRRRKNNVLAIDMATKKLLNDVEKSILELIIHKPNIWTSEIFNYLSGLYSIDAMLEALDRMWGLKIIE